METFSDYDNLVLYDSSHSYDMLESHTKKFWVSGDFKVAKNTVLKPNRRNIVKVKIEKSLFPDIATITPRMLEYLEISMRSCFAQS
jgi:hypothetical protein